jgi:hypothetical protein
VKFEALVELSRKAEGIIRRSLLRKLFPKLALGFIPVIPILKEVFATLQISEPADFAVFPLRLFPLNLNFFHRCFLDKIMSTWRAEVSIYHEQSINKYFSTYLKIRAD